MLSDRIRLAADVQRLSQAALARKIGKIRSYVSGDMLGRIKPGTDALRDIATALGVTVGWLLAEEPTAAGASGVLDHEIKGLPPEAQHIIYNTVRAMASAFREMTRTVAPTEQGGGGDGRQDDRPRARTPRRASIRSAPTK